MDTWRSNRIWNLSRYLTTEDSELLRNRLQSKINSISLRAHISYMYSLFGFVSVKIDISYAIPRNGPSYKTNRKSKICKRETRPGYNQPLYNEKNHGGTNNILPTTYKTDILLWAKRKLVNRLGHAEYF